MRNSGVPRNFEKASYPKKGDIRNFRGYRGGQEVGTKLMIFETNVTFEKFGGTQIMKKAFHPEKGYPEF